MNKKISYIPTGVCTKKFEIEIENGTIKSLQSEGGCNGNIKGIGFLLQGMEVEEAIKRMEGITCKTKDTSCPDQIAKALKNMIEGDGQ